MNERDPDKIKFDRKEDLENLRQIPVISTKMVVIEKEVTGLKEGMHEFKQEVTGSITKLGETVQEFQIKFLENGSNIKIDVEGAKKDISWLKGWHNKVVLGIVLSILTGTGALVFSFLIKR